MKKIDELLKKYDVQAMNNDKFREELFVLFGVSKSLIMDKTTYTASDINNSYRKGQNNDTYRLKNGTVILPNNYEGVDG